jgi:uncharacterized membrane protein
MQYKKKFTALSLLFWVDLFMIPIFVPWVWANGEIIMVFEANMNATEWFRFTGTAALGGVRALAQFFVLSYTTATTMSVANTFALVLNIVISLIWQDEEDDEENGGEIILLYAGIGVVILFSAFYAYLKSSKDACCGVMRSSGGGGGGGGGH